MVTAPRGGHGLFADSGLLSRSESPGSILSENVQIRSPATNSGQEKNGYEKLSQKMQKRQKRQKNL